MRFGAQGKVIIVRLEYIVVHPANRGRGVADRLVSEVCRMEEAKGVQHFRAGLWCDSSLFGAFG